MNVLKNPRVVFFLCLLPLLGSAYYLSRYAVTGLPLMDDFTYTTAFIFPFEEAQGLWEKWKVLFVQHFVTEHRIPMGKLVIYGLYRLGNGHLDLTWLAWSGNVCIPGVVGILWWVYRKTALTAWYFVPVAWLVFQVQHYELFFWSNCSLLYVPVVFFALGATYFLIYHREYSPWRFGLALLCTLLCMYSFGNGMFVFATNALLLTYQHRWRALVLMLALGAVCVVTYFVGYHSEYKTWVGLLAVVNFLALLGSWLEPLNALHPAARLLALGLGLGVVVLFAGFVGRVVWQKLGEWRWVKTSWRRDVSREELFLTVGLVFVIMTGAAVALKRSSPDFGEMFTSRYRYISVLALAMVYLLGIIALRPAARPRLAGVTLALGVLLHGLSYPFYLPRLVNDRERLIAGAFNYRHHQRWCLFPSDSFWARYIDNGTTTAMQTGLFRFPAQFYSESEAALLQPDTTRQLALPLALRPTEGGVLITNDTFTPAPDSRADREGTDLLLYSPDHGVFMVPIQRLANAGRKNLLRGRVFGKGFAAFLPAHTYPAGTYRLGLIHRAGGHTEIGYTPETVVL
jgi:hypothetical protein